MARNMACWRTDALSFPATMNRPSACVAGAASAWSMDRQPAGRHAHALRPGGSARTPPVLLTGETGTGKEVFARAHPHAQPARGTAASSPVNCGAIPETLLESELFGHERGAFTGAAIARSAAGSSWRDGGTLFLDEIGELPLALQVKLLRLLQERTLRAGGQLASRVAANFRLVAATNRDLADEVRAGRFRSDLYYRLHVCPVRLPPLRERREDIPPSVPSLLGAPRRGRARSSRRCMPCLSALRLAGQRARAGEPGRARVRVRGGRGHPRGGFAARHPGAAP